MCQLSTDLMDTFVGKSIVDIEGPLDSGCLAYYTVPSNIGEDGMMCTMKKKHVGICVGGFAGLYGKTTITRYTKLPPQYTVLTLEQIQALKPAKAKKA